MRLTDLNPAFVRSGGEGVSDAEGNPVPERRGVGLAFDCPCGCGQRVYVDFQNPIDGGPARPVRAPMWQRTGAGFKTLTLHPSILSSKDKGGCGWHGWIRNGEVISV